VSAPAVRSRLASLPAWAWVVPAVLLGAGIGVLSSRGAVAWPALAALAVGLWLAIKSFDRLEFGLVALLFAMPLDRYGQLIETPITLTVFQVVLLVCLAAWARDLWARKEGPRFSWIDAGIALMVLAGLWSLPFSLARSTTLVSVARLTFLWALALLYANGIRDTAGLRRVINALAVSGVVLGALGLAQYFVPGFDLGSVRDILRAGGAVAFSRVGAFFHDPNFLAAVLSAIAAMALSFLSHAGTGKMALAWGAVLAVTGAALLVTFSRGGWLGGAAGLLVAVLTAPKTRRAWLLGAMVAAVLAAAVMAPDAVVSRGGSPANGDTDVSVGTRDYMNVSMVRMIADRPVTGTGLGAFDRAYPDYRMPGTSLDIVKPHQVPLTFVVETGLLGAFAQLVLAGGLIALYWRRRPDGWDATEAAVLSGTIALMAGSLFENYLYFEYVWLFFGLSVVATRLARTREGIL